MTSSQWFLASVGAGVCGIIILVGCITIALWLYRPLGIYLHDRGTGR